MGWKIYFWFFNLLIFGNVVAEIVGNKFSLIMGIDLVVSVMSSVGLFAYAYKKKLLTATFWKSYFAIYVTWELLNAFLIYPRITGSFSIGTTIAGLIFLIPLCVALFLYAFKFLENSR